MLDIAKNKEGNELVIALTGRLDTTTAPQLENEVKPALDDVTKLVFDLEKLDYISSAGLRVMLSAQKIMNKQGTMVIRNTPERVKDVFDVTGFSDILSFE